MSKKRLAVLCPYPLGVAPSQRFRFEQYLDSLHADGWDVSTYSFLNSKGWDVFYKESFSLKKVFFLMMGFSKRWLLMTHIWRFQKIFIHREASPIGPPIFEWIIAKVFKKKFIYDFDDAIWLPNYSKQHQKIHRLKAYWKINYIMRWANHNLAGNEFLANYALKVNEKVTIFPTSIDTQYHRIQEKKMKSSLRTLGWTGSHSTMEYLRLLVPTLERLSQHYTFEFIVISNQAPTFEIPGLKFIPWNLSSEIEDLGRIDLGLMPLTDDDWSKGKCGFKALQYLSLGIPAVVSNVGVNKKIIKHGLNGFLIDKPEQWYTYIEYFFKHPEAKSSMGIEGRKHIEEQYSLNSLIPIYLSIFNQ